MPPVAPPATPPGQPAQPPFGSSPATGPTANRGEEVVGLKQLGVVLDGLVMVLQRLGANSPAGQDVTDAIKKLSKHVPPGSVTPADKMNVYQQMMMKTQQQGQQMAQMQKQQAQPPGGGAQQMPGAAAA